MRTGRTVLASLLLLGASVMAATGQDTIRTVPQSQAEVTLSFAPVVKKAAPAVVNIYTKKIVERRTGPFAGDPFFERFFQDMFPRQRNRRRIESALGSGVILDPSGIVVSNQHVIDGADEISVVLQDRREFEGRVIFEDSESDIAILQLKDAEDLPTLTLRDSDLLEVGDLVLAIGNPFGVGQTVTSGIISGLARSGGNAESGFFIQTDAAINPGNSGGALVDMHGRLVGVNTAILSRSGGSNGIGFAIPANLVARVIESVKAGAQTLERPWLGLDAVAVTGDIAEALDLAVPRGLLLEELHPTSPLLSAGLRRGDIVTALDGLPVNTEQELNFRVATRALGDSVRLDFLRSGRQRSAEIPLAAPPETPARDEQLLESRALLPRLRVMNINPAVIEERDLPISASGVFVISADGPARRIGMRPRDIVLAVNEQETESVAAFVAALRDARGTVTLSINRAGRVGKLTFRRG